MRPITTMMSILFGHSAQLLVIASLAGCPTTKDDTDTDTDTDTETETETDTETDTDTDTDTDTAKPCSGSQDLEFVAEGRDANGAACTTCDAGAFYLAGIVANPCSSDIVVSLQPNFYSSVALTPTAGGMGIGVAYAAQPTQNYTVPAGGSIEYVDNLGAFGVGQYKVTASFTDPAKSEASVLIDLK